MINPLAITNFNRTRKELELFWIFGILVAGKNSDWAATKVLSLFKCLKDDETPFQWIRENATQLHNVLVANRVGQYNRIERALIQSAEIDIATADLKTLLGVFGVGPKTARFFLLHTRRDCEVAVLDVHILRWLREECGQDEAPTQTPPMAGGHYERWEKICIYFMKARFPGIAFAEIDLMLWAKMSGRLEESIWLLIGIFVYLHHEI